MNHYAKWLLSVFLMGFISVTALAAGGGGNTEGVPFPVPLSCYSEDAGSEEFLAAIVMAAGSVMKEPSRGAIIRIENHQAAGEPPPSPANIPSNFSENFTTGLEEAMAMITTTNNGSI